MLTTPLASLNELAGIGLAHLHSDSSAPAAQAHRQATRQAVDRIAAAAVLSVASHSRWQIRQVRGTAYAGGSGFSRACTTTAETVKRMPMSQIATPDTTAIADRAETPEAGEHCAACTHAMNAHDAIEARYCAATTSLALPRGCICGS